ncbi:hypothetical protein L2Y96_10390 [Luteibacter aegosomaticola]|uniref:hypothetical protein n=1 Tax=Luteibacter aegosomaticola TaxID=2911538 RepID=UPI001FFAA02E|nr:hypothetical protein [Luteibacter aegosomaticola]UPG92149.1 hypothetical protein L2Y96_10390 [Luteibacter aegosomaticola]
MAKQAKALSIRRIVALVVALFVHFAGLAVLLRPAMYRAVSTREADVATGALQVQLLARQVPKAPPARVPTPPSIPITRPTPVRRHTAAISAPVAPLVQQPSPPEAATQSLATPEPSTAPAMGDGGFQQHLQEAQHAQAIHGVPGSDQQLAPGIRLIDPRTQGVGAFMRNAQRLFGVTSKACHEVEVWSKMSVEELVARHITPAEVKAANEKYECNRPLGLSF